MKTTKFYLVLMLFVAYLISFQSGAQNIIVKPISHGTLVLEHNNTVVYVDPVGGKAAFEGQKSPNLILITDIHGDHFSLETLKALDLKNTILVAPEVVVDQLPRSISRIIIKLDNGESYTPEGYFVEAIPMYNLRKEALKFHTKGRGNGYVITLGGERIYISGDTEDIPEMRALKNIDIAFICMNLPYTMTEEKAASAVIEFKPKQVYPYHYRGTKGLSDISKFKNLVNAGDSTIDVILKEWY